MNIKLFDGIEIEVSEDSELYCNSGCDYAFYDCGQLSCSLFKNEERESIRLEDYMREDENGMYDFVGYERDEKCLALERFLLNK